MRGRYQGGSLAGFIIIGAALTLVLVGGLYGLNRYNAEQTKQVATDESDSDGSSNSEKSSDSSESKSSSNEATSDSKDAASEPTPGSSNENKGESSNDTSSKSSSTMAQSGKSAQETLPTTGPADALAATIAVIALTAATAYYVQSRAHTRP